MVVRVANWNFERRGPKTWQAASLVTEISAFAPDLICLTEAHKTSLEILGGHTIDHVGYRATRKKESERLVMLWSKAPWQPIQVPKDLQALGGLVCGVTQLSARRVCCIGLCIPYHMAKLDGEDRTRPWHHHKVFLRAVTPWLRQQAQNNPVILLGDFNQRIPRKYGSQDAYALLEEALSPFHILTSGGLQPLSLQTIDHICTNQAFIAKSIEARSRFDEGGRPRSDHFGVFAELDRVPLPHG